MSQFVRARFERDTDIDGVDGRFNLVKFWCGTRKWNARDSIRTVLDDADAAGWLEIDVPEVAPFSFEAIEVLEVFGEIKWSSYQTVDGRVDDVDFEVHQVLEARVYPQARLALGRALALLRLPRRVT